MHPGPALVLFAVPDEARPFRRLGLAQAVVAVSGMGRRHAVQALDSAAARHRPSLVLTCGFAGGLNPRWKTGDVLGSADPGFPLAPHFAEAGIHEAVILCHDRIAPRARDKAALFQKTGADAVEMESGAIRDRCQSLGLPSATLRVISDEAGTDLPVDFNQLVDADQQLRLTRLVAHLLTHPGTLPGLLRLQKNCALASRRLAGALERILRPPGALSPR